MADMKFEKLENNQVKMTVAVDAETFEKAVQKAYQRKKPQLQVQGFRKGKVPRSVAEKMLGKDYFYQDAVEELVQTTYPEAVDACEEEVISAPVFTLESFGPEGLEYTAVVTVKPEVRLGEYKGIKVTKKDTSFTEEDVDTRIREILQQHAAANSVSDRAVQDGDAIKLNFRGSVDGSEFEGGSAEDYPLVIGSGMFIPGFEEQLIGVMPGSDAEVRVTFPEEYPEESLKGKDAVFQCHVNEIVETIIPELNDDYVNSLNEEWKNVEDFRQAVRDQLKEEKEGEAQRAQVIEIMDALIESAEIDLPDVMIDVEAKNMADDFIGRIEEQGMSGEQYFDFTGSNMEALAQEMREAAEKKVRGKLILEQVAKEQDLKVSEEEVADGLKDIFMSAGHIPTDEEVKKMAGEGFIEDIRSDLLKQKAQNWLAEHASVE